MSEDNELEVDVFVEYDHVKKLHKEIESILTNSDGLLSAVAPTVSHWSPSMQLEHICLANKMVTSGLLAISTSRLEITGTGNMNRLGKVLLGRGVIPRGKAQAPDQYKPDPESSVDSVRQLFEKVDDRLTRIGDHLESIAEMTEGFDHPYFGTLPAPVWIRFMHVHSLHHMKIIHDIIEHFAAHDTAS